MTMSLGKGTRLHLQPHSGSACDCNLCTLRCQFENCVCRHTIHTPNTRTHTLAHIADCASVSPGASVSFGRLVQLVGEEYLLVVEVEFVVVVSAMSVCICVCICVCVCVFAWACLPWHIVASHLKKLLIFTHFIFGATTASCRCPLLLLLPLVVVPPSLAAVALTTWNIVSALKRHHAHN